MIVSSFSFLSPKSPKVLKLLDYAPIEHINSNAMSG